VALVDGKSHTNQWAYDQFGRLTNVVDATGTSIQRFKYDQDSRLTNCWTAAKGDTFYTVDLNGNVTFINYPSRPDISFGYDALNRVTNTVDGADTSVFTYTSFARGVLCRRKPWGPVSQKQTENRGVLCRRNKRLLLSGMEIR
jgi:YD repeat-containing protein